MAESRGELLQGTLHLLILKALESRPLHGYAIVRRIEDTSDAFLRVEEGSLYPALHRMERHGWIESEWGVSESNRRAKFYTLTRSGRRQLREELTLWERTRTAIDGVLRAHPKGA